MVMTLTLLTAVLLSTVPMQAQATPRGGIMWTHDLDQALKRSGNEGKPVIAFFTDRTGVRCRHLEKDVFQDSGVAELSRKFIWVRIDRDKTPDIPKEFNIRTYPTFLTLSAGRSKIHQFGGYQTVSKLLANLQKGLEIFGLYRKGTTSDRPDSPEIPVSDSFTVSAIPFESSSRIYAMTMLGDSLWIRIGMTLIKLDPRTGEVKARIRGWYSVTGLCNDGEYLYLLSGSWGKGAPIVVMDPEEGTPVREIITRENLGRVKSGSQGIAYRNGKLYVEALSRIIHEIDPATGDITRTIHPKDPSWGMDFDGKDLFAAGGKTLLRIDPRTGRTLKKIPLNISVHVLCMDGDQILVTEWAECGFMLKQDRNRKYPKKYRIYRLSSRN